ncbi:MAG: 3-dehydroquinate synthase [bacterium]|nr:3-dehydroquinate synthase [bacterium]
MTEIKNITVHYDEAPIYDICIENDFALLYKELEKIGTKNKKVCIVCDSNTKELYLNEVIDIVKDYAMEVESFSFPAGEESKNLDVVKQLYTQLIESRFDRSDLLIALGGGVVGDLTGYTAATYLRGISFMQIPTTLLAMVDSSIGGKTGVDFDSYKNMVGAFHQPKSVYINTSCLKSLDKRIFVSGIGEVIKYGLINDLEFYEWLKENREDILSYKPDALKQMIYRCCKDKQYVVENDPTEKGMRALLNLGHTIGHAVEKLKNFSLYHGECVSIGMVAAARLSENRGNITAKERNEIEEMLASFTLPISVSDLKVKEVLAATKNDKKMQSGKIKFILLEKVGQSVIDDSVSDEEMEQAIQYIIKK